MLLELFLGEREERFFFRFKLQKLLLRIICTKWCLLDIVYGIIIK